MAPRKLPKKKVQCESCGYNEIESLQCSDCSGWFCFGCSCISSDTLPSGAWSCPYCTKISDYDRTLQVQIAVSRKKMGAKLVPAQVENTFSQLVFDLSSVCAWDEWDRNIGTLVTHIKSQLCRKTIPAMLPFHSLHYSEKVDKRLMRQISEAYSLSTKEQAMKSVGHTAGNGKAEFHLWKHDTVTENIPRLRVGYISSDFVNHPTADLLQSALLSHDTDKFEIFLYSITEGDDSAYHKTLKQRIEHFRTFSPRCSDKQCAQVIAADRIHILINLNGHTAHERNGICALRPAPLQLVYLGYPGTMGADFIDYIVTDSTVCPQEHREHYTERVLEMPFCYQTNSCRSLYSEVHDSSSSHTRAEHQLPGDCFVFCNFCRLGRITPELFAVWLRIMNRVPHSVLWLHKHPKTAALRLQEEARKANFDPRRLIFGSYCSPKVEHLKRVSLADLCLDTLVYNGHTTGSDMLWAGVPFVTMRGDNWPSLVGSSLASALEMPEMVVDDLAAYEELAVDLATNPAKLLAWKRKLAEKRTTAPLFDHERWVRSFEGGLRTVWDMRRRGEKPRDVQVRDVGSGFSEGRGQPPPAMRTRGSKRPLATADATAAAEALEVEREPGTGRPAEAGMNLAPRPGAAPSAQLALAQGAAAGESAGKGRRTKVRFLARCARVDGQDPACL